MTRPARLSLRLLPQAAGETHPLPVQTMLGHSELEMTELYLNDRGLSRNEWKRVEVAAVD